MALGFVHLDKAFDTVARKRAMDEEELRWWKNSNLFRYVNVGRVASKAVH